MSDLNPEKHPQYNLKLANGDVWTITADSPVHGWASAIARIMGLNEEPGEYPNPPFRLIFRSCNDQGIHKRHGNHSDKRRRYCFDEIAIWHHPDTPDSICEVNDEEPDIMGIWESLFPVYSRVRQSGGLPMHAALLENRGRGVLLAGISNSGKSTCCRRIPPPWNVLCDEESLIVPRVTNQGYSAHPFPTWSLLADDCGRLCWDVKKTVPVNAVFFLEKTDSDAVALLGRGLTAMHLFSLAEEKCHIDWDVLEKEERVSGRRELFENACALAEIVPGYRLEVSRDGCFWEKIEGVL